LSWLLGFASGVNSVKDAYSKQYYDLSRIGGDEQWAFVVEYCRRNPNSNIAAAAEDMMLHRLRLIAAPPLRKPDASMKGH
jgi:hypothetical protein